MKAAIFDIDGTLIDSVSLHGKAWRDALKHFGKDVEFQEVRDQIGKGGDELLPVFLTAAEIKKFGEELKEYRGDLFRKEYMSQVKPFPLVRELFLVIKESGKQIAIGSSAKTKELEHYIELLNIQDLIDVQTCAEDVQHSKPHPDIFQVVLERLRTEPAEAVVIGDSPYDALAAKKAGISSIGVLCGGFSKSSLFEAGVSEVYEGPGELLEKYSESLIEV